MKRSIICLALSIIILLVTIVLCSRILLGDANGVVSSNTNQVRTAYMAVYEWYNANVEEVVTMSMGTAIGLLIGVAVFKLYRKIKPICIESKER